MRASGILMHISSLPSPYGIGTFGKESYNFVDMLHDMIDEAEDTKYYDAIETIDKNDYVYVGIEVGIPTVDMIKE